VAAACDRSQLERRRDVSGGAAAALSWQHCGPVRLGSSEGSAMMIPQRSRRRSGGPGSAGHSHALEHTV